MKRICVIRKLSRVLPYLDCGDVLYNQPNNESLCQKII